MVRVNVRVYHDRFYCDRPINKSKMPRGNRLHQFSTAESDTLEVTHPVAGRNGGDYAWTPHTFPGPWRRDVIG